MLVLAEFFKSLILKLLFSMKIDQLMKNTVYNGESVVQQKPTNRKAFLNLLYAVCIFF